MPRNEFSRKVVVEPWPVGGVAIDVWADPAEREALAGRFGLIELVSLRGRGQLERVSGEIVYRGRLEAEVVQSCVVTLEGVPATLDHPMERRYRLDRGADVDVRRAVIEGSDEDDEVEMVVGGEIDIGEAVAEELGLTLEPYPRAPDADLAEMDLGPDVSVGVPPHEKPLAALRQLQKHQAG